MSPISILLALVALQSSLLSNWASGSAVPQDPHPGSHHRMHPSAAAAAGAATQPPPPPSPIQHKPTGCEYFSNLNASKVLAACGEEVSTISSSSSSIATTTNANTYQVIRMMTTTTSTTTSTTSTTRKPEPSPADQRNANEDTGISAFALCTWIVGILLALVGLMLVLVRYLEMWRVCGSVRFNQIQEEVQL